MPPLLLQAYHPLQQIKWVGRHCAPPSVITLGKLTVLTVQSTWLLCPNLPILTLIFSARSKDPGQNGPKYTTEAIYSDKTQLQCDRWNYQTHLKSQFVWQTLSEVSLHVGDRNSVMRSLGSRATRNNRAQIQLINLHGQWMHNHHTTTPS